jgi:hypothetical protein
VVVSVRSVGEPGRFQPGRPAKVTVGPGHAPKRSPECFGQTRKSPMAPRSFIVEHGQGSTLFSDGPQGSDDPVQGLVPGNRPEIAPRVSPEGCCESVTVVYPLDVGQALETHFTGSGGVFGISLDLDQPSILHGGQHAARAIAVAWADSADNPARHGRSELVHTAIEASGQG